MSEDKIEVVYHVPMPFRVFGFFLLVLIGVGIVVTLSGGGVLGYFVLGFTTIGIVLWGIIGPATAKVVVKKDSVEIKSLPYGKMVFRINETLDVQQTEDMDLTNCICWRTFGMSFGGCHIGRYKGINDERVFLLYVEGKKALVLTQGNQKAIITHDRIDELYDQLQIRRDGTRNQRMEAG